LAIGVAPPPVAAVGDGSTVGEGDGSTVGDGEGDGEGEGVGVGAGVGLGVGAGVGVGVGDGAVVGAGVEFGPGPVQVAIDPILYSHWREERLESWIARATTLPT
jgi:hypothetical protein